MRAGKRAVDLGGASWEEEKAWEKAPEWHMCTRGGSQQVERGPKWAGTHICSPCQELELYPESKGNLPTCTKYDLCDHICVFQRAVAPVRRMHRKSTKVPEGDL